VNIIQTKIPDVIIFEPKILGDERGYFLESFRYEWLLKCGINKSFVQDNISRSRKGSLRGLHYQLYNEQAKLVMVTKGEVLDVAVDIRLGSPTFGKYVMHKLSAENRNLMYIPEGFAHGFQVLSETADFMYKCSNYYDPEAERGIKWNDPAIGIQWMEIEPIISNKDLNLINLNEVQEKDLPKILM
jgi:dTDP-4-dehydrorhamnose 3,5-epimerase